jgi:hypothetical protein
MMAGGESPIKFFAADYPGGPRNLKERLDEAMRLCAREIVTPGVVKDWADFVRRMGIVQGLQSAIGICDRIDKEMRS